jgi:hypothetical protein
MARWSRFSSSTSNDPSAGGGMITQLASPSVCVVDDEQPDYEAILRALNELYVSCVHILGNDIDKLPPQPFRRVQLVFLDLHLTSSVGKNAASHTANVFTRIVSPETAPIVVVIWSKYAQDRVADENVPAEDQETEAQLFMRTLLESEPRYKGRLIFIEMSKPQHDARPGGWTETLKAEIDRVLRDQVAVEALWSWDSMVRDASMKVSEELTAIAATSAERLNIELKEGLKDAMQRLTKAQAESDLSAETAPGHLVTVLTQLLMDQLDHMDHSAISAHGTWLAADPANAAADGFAARMNGLLLTAAVSPATVPFFPGTVYRITDEAKFAAVFGRDVPSLLAVCTNLKATQAEKWAAWNRDARPVLLEISPACDVAQNKRVSALLVAGVIVPAALAKSRERSRDAFVQLPLLSLRWNAPDFVEQDAALIFCHRYRITTPPGSAPDWIEPWFRLRVMPAMAISAAHAGNAARIGYFWMQD